MINSSLKYGELNIAEEVIAMIAMIAVSEIDGVASTVSGMKEDLYRAVNRRGMPKGIVVTSEQDGVVIDLKISVYYDKKISDVCQQLQAHIKEQVEMMSSIPVLEVNVMVDKVNFKVEEK